MRHAEALQRASQTARATALVRTTWIEGDFGRREERTFRKRFSKLLRREDDLARLDRLLWRHKYRPAQRQARRLGKGHAALAEARIALARRSPGVDYAIKQVPEALKSDPGLVYERARWRQRKNRYDGVIELIDPPLPDAPHAARWMTPKTLSVWPRGSPCTRSKSWRRTARAVGPGSSPGSTGRPVRSL